MAIAIVDRAAARALARPHRPRRLRHDLGLQRRPRRAEPGADRLLRRVLPDHAGVLERHRRARPARDPADPHQRLRRRPAGEPRHRRRRPRHGHVRPPGGALGRAPARPAADLRRHQDLDRQRHRHRDHRAAGGRAHARRPDHLRLRPRARRPDRRVDRRRRARRRRRGGPVGRAARGHAHRREARRSALPAEPSRGGSRPSHEAHTTTARPAPDRPLRVRRGRLRRGRGGAHRHARLRVRLGRQDPARRGQRRGPAHHRLEELHRAEGARRDLRPGPRGRRLHGQQGPQPRRREDRPGGAEVRRDHRLPRVHGHGAAVVLRQDRRRAAQGPAGRLRGGQGGLRGRRPGGPPADAVHVLQRGRRHAGHGRRPRPEDDLRPRGQVAGPGRSTARPSAASGSTACSACSRSTA